MTSAGAAILFVVDAGADAGIGHLSRSTALAEALGRLNASCVFASSGHPAVVEKIRAVNASPVPLAAIDAESLTAVARDHGCRTVIIDSYAIGDSTRAAVRAHGLFVAVIDDLAQGRFSSHLVVNGGPNAATLSYEAADDTVLLLGPEYAMLRPEFKNSPRRRNAGAVRRVLVTLGGGTNDSVIGAALEGLAAVGHDFEVVVVRGLFTSSTSDVALAALAQKPLSIISNPVSMSAVMREADLAICGGGQTLLELAAVGTPSVVVEMSDNQRGAIEALTAAGAARLAGTASDPRLPTSIQTIVANLCGQAALRDRMSGASQRLIDGQGAMRVAGTLLQSL